jgi:hypothetical protein
MADEPNTPDPTQAFQKLLERNNNDGVKLAAQLFDENFQYRGQIRELKEKAPKEGAVTLTADEAKLWKAYQDLGVEPKEIKKSLDKLPDLEKTNKELAGMETLREMAEIGLDGSKLKLSVLKDQMQKFPDAVVRFATQKDKDGNEAKVAFIKPTTDGTESPFTEFAAQNLSDYLPSLKVNAEQSQPLQPGNTHDPKPQGGAASVFDRIRESVKAKGDQPKVDIDARFGRPANA